MKRMTKKLYGILILAMLSTPVHAGWLSNVGQRIVNGAVNTVQNNISGKVNKNVNDTMDGKLTEKGKKGKKNSSGDNAQTQGIIVEYPPYPSCGATTNRGKPLKYTNNYKKIDLGDGKYIFSGELIYDKNFLRGEKVMLVEEFLDTGLYIIYASGENVVVFTDDQVGFGCSIKAIKARFANEDLHLSADSIGNIYLIEVLPPQGDFNIFMMNYENLMGYGSIQIYKVPEEPKFMK